MASSDVVRQMDKNARPLALSGHVGFDSLPDQLVNKSTSQGFCFNILCIGETGMFYLAIVDFIVTVEVVLPGGAEIKRSLPYNYHGLQGHLPFAVVGSTEEVNIGSKMVKARQYPWGVVQVENESHCDFVKLREMLICVNMEDLREQTHTRHYELYRRCKLEEMGFTDTDPECKPVSLQQTYEEKRQEFLGELQRREEEMRQTFVQRVKEKESELKDAERELQGKFEQLKRLHAEEKSKLEEKRRSLEEDMSVFSKRRAASELLQAQAFNTNNKKDKDRKK
ncbi:hypothetical protein cypCar_00043592 [Cyprinus carpio]|nr:hypothetical protein cypCar_00043592 [Cyprinus carpio]